MNKLIEGLQAMKQMHNGDLKTIEFIREGVYKFEFIPLPTDEFKFHGELNLKTRQFFFYGDDGIKQAVTALY